MYASYRSRQQIFWGQTGIVQKENSVKTVEGLQSNRCFSFSLDRTKQSVPQITTYADVSFVDVP